MVLSRNAHFRRRPNRRFVFGNFYLNPSAQYSTTVISAILFAGIVFSGFLLFRFADTDDLLARGRRQLYEGKVAWAAKTFETLVARHKDSYDGYLLLGETYLQLEDRPNAERAFLAATALRGGVKKGQTTDVMAGIALSKLLVAKGQFAQAEQQLQALWKQQPGAAQWLLAAQPDPSQYTTTSKRPAPPNHDINRLQSALFLLYQRWAEVADNTHSNYSQTIAFYEKALLYAQDITQETQIKEKLIETISVYCEHLDLKTHTDDVVHMLKKSLRYRYIPDTLINIAEAYEKTNKLDDAITWYRKAFDVNPSLISLKLSNMLMRRANELLLEKKSELAEPLFEEAKKINATATIPLEALYPVSIDHLAINAPLNSDSGDLPITVTMTVQNQGERPIPVLLVKTTFYAANNTTDPLAEAIETVASADKPLGGKHGGLKATLTAAKQAKPSDIATVRPDHQPITLKPNAPILIDDLGGGSLKVVVSVAYSQTSQPEWKELLAKSITIKTPTTSPAQEESTNTTSPPPH
jgi:tetratricopeptide (TPR) repeat protein